MLRELSEGLLVYGQENSLNGGQKKHGI